MSSILFNIPSLISQSKLRMHNQDMMRSVQRMSTGQRINQSSDDPLGNSISEEMRTQLRGMAQARRNASEGAALLQIAEGSCSEMSSILQRMRELAVQGANDTMTSTERHYLNIEMSGLRHELDRISSASQYNGKSLLDGGEGSFASASNPGVLHVGANDQEHEDFVKVRILPLTAGTLGLQGVAIRSQAESVLALEDLDNAIRSVGTVRSNLGSMVNRMDHVAERLAENSNDLQSAESKIRDTDYAKEATALSVKQILQQSSIAMIAQANSQPQSVLELFR
jgi:flagellin